MFGRITRVIHRTKKLFQKLKKSYPINFLAKLRSLIQFLEFWKIGLVKGKHSIVEKKRISSKMTFI